MASPRAKFAALVTAGLAAAYIAFGGAGAKDDLKDKVQAAQGGQSRDAQIDAAVSGATNESAAKKSGPTP
jgi:hypothetical protein